MHDRASQPLWPAPWWARWRWQLCIQLSFALLYQFLWYGLAGGEPFVAPTLIDFWVFVGLSAIVGWMYCQMAFGFAQILTRSGAGGGAYSLLVIWNLLVAYRFFQIPSEYAADLIKFTTRH